MKNRVETYSKLAFVCSIISAGIYCYGVQQLVVRYEYQNAWTNLVALLPIVALMITSLFTGEIKNSRKIPIIITAPLFVISLVDSVSNEATFLPKTTMNLFDVITGDELLSKCSIIVFTYVVFALMIFFIPLCKPIWAKAFCLFEAGLYLFSILYFLIDDYYDLNIVGLTTGISYVLFFIGLFFIFCTIAKDYNKDYEEEPKKLDYTPFFKSGAYLEIAHDTAEKNHIDYASFYEFIKKSDFKSIIEKGYYGHDFALKMIVDLHNILEVLINDNSSFELILLKQKTDELYNVRNDLYAFDLKFFLFLQFLSNADEEDLKTIAVDINSKSEFPINMLSNFASNSFTLDGVNIASMEGFLQSLKYKDTDDQRRICALTGNEAKKAGRHHNFWKITQVLYWNGKKINRYSSNYTNLITKAYDAMAESNPEFVKILLWTGHKVLVHSLGKRYKWQTVLTEDEFTEEQLVRLRSKYREAKDGE